MHSAAMVTDIAALQVTVSSLTGVERTGCRKQLSEVHASVAIHSYTLLPSLPLSHAHSLGNDVWYSNLPVDDVRSASSVHLHHAGPFPVRSLQLHKVPLDTYTL